VVVRLGFSGGTDPGVEPLVAGLLRVLASEQTSAGADSDRN